MIRNILAIIIAKLVSFLLKIFNVGSGTNLPGRIALIISPTILTDLVNQTKKEIITVSGTNGKTTTCGFISSILRTDGKTFAHNRKGANMLDGITTAIVQSASIFGKLNVDDCLLESDEAYLAKFSKYFAADYLLITNLFRDQLDRYGELDTTAKKLEEAVEGFLKKKNLKVILNADDPVVSNLAKNAERLYFGFDQIEFCDVDENIETAQEVANCPCGMRYEYSQIFYGHLGHYFCKCSNQRPTPDIIANAKVFSGYSELEIKMPSKNIEFKQNINMPGLYNAYNALAAIALCLALDIDPYIIKAGMSNYTTVFGRAEKLALEGKDVLIQLIKNPAGATEVLRTVKDDPNSRLLIIINDNYADGRDVSWLWDANFELLKNYSKTVITSGKRATDMAVRLKYAEIPAENIQVEEDIYKAIKNSIVQTAHNERLYILPTYTALLDMQKILKKFKS